MSSNITELLAAILSAKYGEEVRGSIHDAIELCYADGKAGVNDLEARRLIEAVAAVNESQEADIEALTARVEELEQGEGGGGSEESTSIDIDTLIFDHGQVNQVQVNNNQQVTRHVTFAKPFTEVPTVALTWGKQTGGASAYARITACILYETLSKTGFDFFISNTSGAVRSPTVTWCAWQPTTKTIDLDITIPDAQGMSEAEVREITGPIASAVDAIKTGYDGTTYQTAAEAVRTQINDLHVLIGDEPGTAIDASAIGYNDSNVGAELTDINGRLQGLHETIYKEIVDEKSGTYSATAGSPISSQTHLVDVSIPSGAAYKFVLHADGIVSKYGLYANGTAVQYSLIPGTEYEFTAATDITWLSIYTTADFVTGSGTVTGVVTTTTLNENSLESKVESVGEETINALTNPFELSTADLEDGAIQNGTGIDFASQRRVRTKTYIPATKGTVITCTRGINVWEYDLLTKQYLTDYGDFTYSYTVENDCCIRIMWNAVKTTTEDYTYAELIALTTLGLMTLRKPLIDQSFIKELAVNVVSDEVVFRSQKSNTVKTIAHRGDDILAPQCTAPAYILARKHGHAIAENDLWLSEDGEFVMWHDTSLVRLGNMVDINGYLMYTNGTDYYWVHPTTNAVYTWNGSDYVPSGVALSGLDRCNGTYYGVNSQYSVTGLPLSILKRIDFGVYKGAKFAGTQILTFAEWVLLCKQLGMEIYIDRKLTYTDALLTQAANIVKRYGMGDYASWLGLNTSQITLLRSIIPDSRCGILQHPTAATVQSYQSYNVGRGFFFNGDAKNGMTAEAIQTGLDAGFDVEVWYVDYGNATKEQVFNVLRSAVQYGVTGITTDHYRTDEAFDFLFDTM